MRITARGWRRNAGTSVILDQELRDAKVGRFIRTAHPLTPGTHLIPTETGVRIHGGPEALSLSGQYMISIDLTRDDVMRAFLRCFPEVADVAKAIHDAPTTDSDAAE